MEHKILQKRGDLDMALALFKQLEGTLDSDNVLSELLGIKKIVIEENSVDDDQPSQLEEQKGEVTDIN